MRNVNETAFISLHESSYPRIHAFVRRPIDDDTVAEEITADVFRIVWENGPNIPHPIGLAPGTDCPWRTLAVWLAAGSQQQKSGSPGDWTVKENPQRAADDRIDVSVISAEGKTVARLVAGAIESQAVCSGSPRLSTLDSAPLDQPYSTQPGKQSNAAAPFFAYRTI